VDTACERLAKPRPPTGSQTAAGNPPNLREQSAGNIWKVLVDAGALVETGDPLVLVESMKMEVAISATTRGVVHSVLVKPGQTVRAGDLVMALAEK
jgi:biotin carboxyl carrier protein